MHSRPRVDAPIGDLVSERRLSDFKPLLAAYREAGVQLDSALDGGAGAGTTAKAMLPYLDGSVYAFEPFPGNHRFFVGIDPRIRLFPYALDAGAHVQSFRVSSVVPPDSAWGRRGLSGFSSVGRLVEDEREGDYTVECVRADDVIGEDVRIDFIKLDLQGGELNALQGMPRLLSQAWFLWVEYMGRDDLFAHLVASGFEVFDTEYMFIGEPTDAAREHFEVSRESFTLSTGKTAWMGFRRAPWRSYEAEFQRQREAFGLVHTDFVCVRKDRLAEFERALGFLA